MVDIYGWRARLGLIYPSTSWVMEPEFYAMSPEGVITCTTRIPLTGCDVRSLLQMGQEVPNGARLLRDSRVNAVVLGCTSGSFVNGIEYNNDLIKRMEDAAGVPATTTASSLVNALQALNIERVSIATPYIDEINQRIRSYLEKCEIEVCLIEGLGYLYDDDIHARTLEQNYAYGKRVDRPEAEGVLILCTAMRTVPMIQKLETDLGKPVLSAIQASFWNTLRMAGVREAVSGFGCLLEH